MWMESTNEVQPRLAIRSRMLTRMFLQAAVSVFSKVTSVRYANCQFEHTEEMSIYEKSHVLARLEYKTHEAMDRTIYSSWDSFHLVFQGRYAVVRQSEPSIDCHSFLKL